MALSPAAVLAQKHYERYCGEGRQSVVVPEWGDADSPLVVYWRPFTLGDQIRIFGDGRKSDAGVHAWIVARKAEDRDGKLLFGEPDDINVLRTRADATTVRRIAETIIASPTVEEHAERLRDDALRMAMHALADRLGRTIGEIEAMTVSDFRETLAFHAERQKREKA